MRPRTSAWSFSATACSSSRSRRSCTTATRTRRRGGSRRSARTSSRGRVAPPSRGSCRWASVWPQAAGTSLAGDELSRIVKSRNVTAALLEAAIAALFLEHGYGKIAPAIVAAFSDRIEYARTTHVDHKTELQEALAKTGRSVSYVVVAVDGPAHARHFSCAAQIDGEELGAGTGQTKKEAEQEAAKQALAAIGA